MKRYLIFSILVLLTLHLSPFSPVGEDNTGEYEIKSLLIYRICKFTRWPQPHNPAKPFIISILGRLPGGARISLPEQADIYKRKIIIRKIRKPVEIESSDVLFIASTEAYRLNTILNYCEGKPILTFSDTKGFGLRGVIINFFIEDESVSFEINHNAAKTASVEINSQLYNIATVIRDGKVYHPGEREK